MKSSFIAFALLRLWGVVITALAISAVYILAEPQRLSYFSFVLFQNQETIKTVAIFSIFLGVFFIFYSSSKTPEKYVNLKLFKGPVKLHPDLIRQSLEKWFTDQKIQDVKLVNITVDRESKIGLELRTSNIQSALFSIEDIEAKLQEFMTSSLGVNQPISVQLFEL